MSRKGPFGLWMEMKATDFEEPPNEIAPCMFQAPVVPKPHSAFERYIVQVSPGAGLSWVKAIGKTIETSDYGIELKLAFDDMEQKLTATYGKQKRHDFLLHESIWNEPRDWMQSVLSKERVLMSQWSKESGASLVDSLSSVALVMGAYDTSTGYFAIEYSFENYVQAEAEIAALEDDVL
jgi:hypothetical protein